MSSAANDDTYDNKPRYRAWYGGGCPVPCVALVDIVMRNGTVFYQEMAMNWAWGHSENHPGDIIAYRVIPEGEE